MKCYKHPTVEMDIPTDCHVCHGDGVIEVDDYGEWHTERCWSCHGSGAGYPDCSACIEEYEMENEA